MSARQLTELLQTHQLKPPGKSQTYWGSIFRVDNIRPKRFNNHHLIIFG